VLALTQSVEAKVVYTPAHKHLGPHQSFPLDLNHDGRVDFQLTNFATCGTDQCHYSFIQKPATGNSAVGYFFDGQLILDSAFKPGQGIGPGGAFHEGTAGLVEIVYSSGPESTFSIGKWRNVQDRYLALKFKIKGRTHYGWARFNVQVSKTKISATLTGYAYETTPNKPIIAGQTESATEELNGEDLDTGASLSTPISQGPQRASLGVLALGAQGFLLRRKEPARDTVEDY
jgi:hypothetical protein